MKNFTFIFFFALLLTQAQTFPDPYCSIPNTTVEEISEIQWDETIITNTNSSSVLIDEVDTIVDVISGETYTLRVSGNTYGPFETVIYAFIDWNQNEILDDEGEIYDLGTLFDTDGTDGISVSLDITIPDDAVLGETRIRIIKIYTDEDSVAVIDPCAISMSILDFGIYGGYGQAIDFTLNIEEDEEMPEEFPAPYCDIPVDVEVEEITLIEFGDNVISNSDSSSALLNYTDSILNLSPGETFTLSVQGNTYGVFDNVVYAFIDWNQDGNLDDEGEVYELGNLYNSSGDDDVSVSLDITVPMDAVEGSTRIRVSKIYTDEYSVAVVDPCDISMSILNFGIFSGYGQAIDFTLNIGSLNLTEIQLTKTSVYPVPTRDILHIKNEQALKSIQIFNTMGQQVLTRNVSGLEVQVDISQLKAGAYFIRLLSENGKHENLKIIKK